MPMSTFKATCQSHYERGFAEAVRLAAEVVADERPKNEPSDWTEFARIKDGLCARIAEKIRALTPPQEPRKVERGPAGATYGSYDYEEKP
jgi:hypothetical protein